MNNFQKRRKVRPATVERKLEVSEELKSCENIIITSVQQYIGEAERQLNNIKNYRLLPNDPTKMNNNAVNKTIKIFENEHLIKDKVSEGLVTENSQNHHNPIQSLKFNKKESLEDQLVVQLIAIFQKYRNILISA